MGGPGSGRRKGGGKLSGKGLNEAQKYVTGRGFAKRRVSDAKKFAKIKGFFGEPLPNKVAKMEKRLHYIKKTRSY